MKQRYTIGLVAPVLELGGGVPAVADFLWRTAQRDGRFEIVVASLASEIRNELNVAITRPSSWIRGVQTAPGLWMGRPTTRIGAFAAEFEFQRYRPRRALTHVLSSCDLIQVVCGAPAVANAVLGLGKPVALQVATRTKVERAHLGKTSHGIQYGWRATTTHIMDALDDRALRKADAIQVENPWMLEYARKLNAGREVDLRYAPPGVDTTLFHPIAERDLVKDPYILFVGRLDDPRKNPGALLEAYARLPAELLRTVRLVLAGSCGPEDAFWHRAKALNLHNHVSYIARPDSDELVKLYQNASVFALSSDEEGLGVVILEAMSCGVPVIATRCGGPDGIITDGVDGYLVSLGNPAGMAERLQRLLTDTELNRRMGGRARMTIEARYDEHVAGTVFVDMWDRLLGNSTTTPCAD